MFNNNNVGIIMWTPMWFQVTSRFPALCNTGDVRVGETNSGNDPNGYYYTEGVVEVCIDETYGAVCDEGWDDNAAAVVCRSMGLNAPDYGT